MKLTKKDINILLKHFRELARQDDNGITATDAKMAVTSWLFEIGEVERGNYFQDTITEYIVKRPME